MDKRKLYYAQRSRSLPYCVMIPLVTGPSLLLVLNRRSELRLTLFSFALLVKGPDLRRSVDPEHESMSDTLNLEQPIVLSSLKSVELTSSHRKLSLRLTVLLLLVSVELLSVLKPTLTFKLMPVCVFVVSLDCLVSVTGTSMVSKSSNRNGLVTKVDVSKKVLGESSTFISNENGVLALGKNVVSSGGRR